METSSTKKKIEYKPMVNLKAIREKRNMTQLNLGTRIEISQETVSGYEMGKLYPSADTLVKLADALNTSVDYLLGRITSDKPLNLSKSDLTDDEFNLIYSYRNLSSENRHKLLGYVEALKNN